MCCSKCSILLGLLLTATGILYLLHDMGLVQFNVQWYTIAFLIVGIAMLGKTHCKGCNGGTCAMPVAKPATKATKKRK